MKRRELRNIIRKEIRLIEKQLLREDIFDWLLGNVFDGIKKERIKRAMSNLESDPEYQKLLQQNAELKKQAKELADKADAFISSVNAEKERRAAEKKAAKTKKSEK